MNAIIYLSIMMGVMLSNIDIPFDYVEGTLTEVSVIPLGKMFSEVGNDTYDGISVPNGGISFNSNGVVVWVKKDFSKKKSYLTFDATSFKLSSENGYKKAEYTFGRSSDPGVVMWNDTDIIFSVRYEGKVIRYKAKINLYQ